MTDLSTFVERFDFRDFNGRAAFCSLELLSLADGRTVVIATELAGNTGMSITNAAELIGGAVCRHFGIDPAKLVWIERYDANSYAEHDHQETFDLVTFSEVSATPISRFARPSWRRMTATDWQALGLPPR